MRFRSRNYNKPLVSGYDYNAAFYAAENGEITKAEAALLRLKYLHGFQWNGCNEVAKEMYDNDWIAWYDNPNRSLATPDKMLVVTEQGFEKRKELFEKMREI